MAIITRLSLDNGPCNCSYVILSCSISSFIVVYNLSVFLYYLFPNMFWFFKSTAEQTHNSLTFLNKICELNYFLSLFYLTEYCMYVWTRVSTSYSMSFYALEKSHMVNNLSMYMSRKFFPFHQIYMFCTWDILYVTNWRNGAIVCKEKNMCLNMYTQW